MKKKLFMLMIPLFSFICVGGVDAASVSVKCNDMTVGKNTTCTISVSNNGKSAGIEGKIAISGATFVSASNVSGFQGSIDSSSFAFYGDNKNGSYSVAKLTISAKNVGTATVTVSGVNIIDEEFELHSLPTAKTSFKVKAQTTTTKKPTTTTKPRETTKATTKEVLTTKATLKTTTTAFTTNKAGLGLASVTVDDFEVTTSGGIYYATVNPETTEVIVSAKANADYVVIGTGKRTLTDGKNSVELIVRDQLGNSQTYTLIITKPEGLGNVSTELKNLKIANYGFAFSPSTKEYTVSVPYNTNEVYVIAEGDERVKIEGAGLININGGTTDAIVTVSYGDVPATRYIIHIKKSYGLLFMWIAIGTLGAGLAGALVYANVNKKAAVEKAVNEKNKKLAAEARESQKENPMASMSVGGEKLVGTGKSVVAPTQVVATKPAEPATVATGVVSAQTSVANNTPASTVVKTVAQPETTVKPVQVVKPVVTSPQTNVAQQAPKTVVKTVVKPATANPFKPSN